MSRPRPNTAQRKWWIIGGIGVAIMCALAAWWGISASKGVTANQAGFKVISNDRTQVTWDVITPKKKAVTCTIIAMDDRRNVLGTKTVSLKRSQYTSTRYTDTLRTTARAVTGTVQECHYTGERAPAQ